jgi:prevent-host-death family protein
VKTMAAGEFKAKCLAVLDEVKQTGEPVIITKRGKPVARVTTVEQTADRKNNVDSIFGALKGLISVVGDPDDLVGPIIPLEEWDMLKDDWSPLPKE